MTDCRKKTALVTGASSGLGKEIARQLIADGFRVYVAARRVAQVQAVVGTLVAETGSVDVLVNNAGFGMYGAVEDVAINEAR